MGFRLEVYNNNYVGLIVNYTNSAADDYYYPEDDVQGALEYFNLYKEEGTNRLKKREENEEIVKELGVDKTTIEEYQEKMAVLTDMLSDAQAKDNAILFRNWKSGVLYKKDNRIRYNGNLYKCLQDHTSQDDWAPTVAASLWAAMLIDPEVVDDNGEVAAQEWVQPDSTNPYKKGDKVLYKGSVYESVIDNNVWSPDTYPAGWSLVEG